MDERYTTGVWRDVPMVEGMQCGNNPYANAAYEHCALQAIREGGIWRAMSAAYAERAWEERAETRGIEAPCPLAEALKSIPEPPAQPLDVGLHNLDRPAPRQSPTST